MSTIDLFLQMWGGVAYLLAQILLASAEGVDNGRGRRIAGWISYLAGIPAWVVLLVSKNSWIVAAIDLGSIPAMALGITVAWKQGAQVNKRLDAAVKAFTLFMIIAGVSYSIYYFHGITTFSQILEISVTFTFLSGSYLLAKNKPAGWLLFTLMCICMVVLMILQGKTLLAFQQGFSFIVTITGYIKAIRRRHPPIAESS
jgi:hypothetical protein